LGISGYVVQPLRDIRQFQAAALGVLNHGGEAEVFVAFERHRALGKMVEPRNHVIQAPSGAIRVIVHNGGAVRVGHLRQPRAVVGVGVRVHGAEGDEAAAGADRPVVGLILAGELAKAVVLAADLIEIAAGTVRSREDPILQASDWPPHGKAPYLSRPFANMCIAKDRLHCAPRHMNTTQPIQHLWSLSAHQRRGIRKFPRKRSCHIHNQ
jgi:hypothetical protein